MTLCRVALGLVLASAAAFAMAQSGAGASPRPAAQAEAAPVWAALTVSQQQALAPLKSEWASIDGQRKQKWLDVATRMPGMPEAERQRIQQRMTEWVRMSPAERGRARVQFQETRRIAPDNLQQRWEDYQALPSDQRQALAAKAAQANRKTSQAVAAQNAARADGSPEAKRNVVPVAPASPAPKAVAPTVVQSRPGATTSLVTTKPAPPAHHQAGLPKVNAGAGFVDPETLLPKRGPQGAAALTVSNSPNSPPNRP